MLHDGEDGLVLLHVAHTAWFLDTQGFDCLEYIHRALRLTALDGITECTQQTTPTHCITVCACVVCVRACMRAVCVHVRVHVCVLGECACSLKTSS